MRLLSVILRQIKFRAEEKTMRKYLLPKDGNFYKSNLHVHSVISDGAKTPEEVKKNYMDRGYSVEY